mmetsp:Transcript_23862/g.65559  ORF Transcript_23862/g.65559 Transcript_23862/m.65559 type:complete len:216 (+) Transcript_23862:383-1030(+)
MLVLGNSCKKAGFQRWSVSASCRSSMHTQAKTDRSRTSSFDKIWSLISKGRVRSPTGGGRLAAWCALANAHKARLSFRCIHRDLRSLKTPGVAATPSCCIRATSTAAWLSRCKVSVDLLLSSRGVFGCEPVVARVFAWTTRKRPMVAAVMRHVGRAGPLAAADVSDPGAPHLNLMRHTPFENIGACAGDGCTPCCAPDAAAAAIADAFASCWLGE